MKDLITSIIMMGISIYVYVISAGFHDSDGGIMGDPAYYPRILALILGGMSIALLINTLRKKSTIKFSFNKEIVKNIGLFFALFIAYMVGLQIFGFIISTIIFAFVCILLFGGSWKSALISCLPITFTIYLAFSKLLSMQLPVGSLFK